jgi:hypothetical protein
MNLCNLLWLFAYFVTWKYVDVLIYYICPFSIKHLICMLFLYYTDNLWFWAIFVLVASCYYHPHLTLPLCVCYFFYCSFISSAKWCALHITGIVQSCWSPLYTYLFAYLLLRILWLLRQALHYLSQSDRGSNLLIILSHFLSPFIIRSTLKIYC